MRWFVDKLCLELYVFRQINHELMGVIIGNSSDIVGENGMKRLGPVEVSIGFFISLLVAGNIRVIGQET